MDTILDLDHERAKNFFIQPQNYCNIELPKYFDFRPLLTSIASYFKASNIIKKNNSYTRRLRDYEKSEVNYELYSNKDGNFAWRPLQVINPVAYVYLVERITDKKEWREIVERMQTLQNNTDNVKCCSIPTVYNTKQERASAITNWRQNFERESIRLSLRYNYLLSTDITNCYGSVYTHSIAWAIHGRSEAKNNRRDTGLVGNFIDSVIQDISNGQTNGIPQGSVLMDFIVEIILANVDYELGQKLYKHSIAGRYQVLRYRDDYKILAEHREDVLVIVRALSEILKEYNMSLNQQKTYLSGSIIQDTYKDDKLPWTNIPETDSLEKRLLQVYSFSKEYPNSGSIDSALFKLIGAISDGQFTISFDEDYYASMCILAEIAFSNPRTYPRVVTLLGMLAVFLEESEAEEFFDLMISKFARIPNAHLLLVWLQRLTIMSEPGRKYDCQICKYISKYIVDDKIRSKNLWKFDCLGCKELNEIISKSPIISKNVTLRMPEIPVASEVETFGRY